jgi:hypothetical protein
MTTNIHKYQWKARLLLVETPNYTNDTYKKTKADYQKHIKDYHKRYIKLITQRSPTFKIKLIGLDGTIKKEYTFLNTKDIMKTVDSMPIQKKINKTGKPIYLSPNGKPIYLSPNGKSPQYINLSLFADYNPKTTTPNLGFKNKEKALYTIKTIKNKPLTYQKQVINTMIGRAKSHPNQTQGMRDAINIFEDWKQKHQ